MRLPHSRNTKGVDYAVVGVPWDGATSYRTGQRLAPDATRSASMTIRPFNLALNVVDPAFAPGTGTPEVGGFTSGEAIDLVHGLKGLNFVGFDIVEVLPTYDTADITALLAANLIYEFLSLITLNNKNDRL